MRPRSRDAGLLVLVALVAAGCHGTTAGVEASANDGRLLEPLPIRVVVKPNPAAARPDALLQLWTRPAHEDEPAMVHEQPMSTERTETKVDVFGTDGLEVHVEGASVFTVPRRFWEGMSRGRLVIRLQTGGVELTRSVEPEPGGGGICAGNGQEMTCWQPEKWYFQSFWWEPGDAITLSVVVKIRSLPGDDVDVPVRLHANDIATPALAETSTAALGGSNWEATAELDPDASLLLAIGDRVVEIPPDIWQLTWATARIEIDGDTADFIHHWPRSNRDLREYRDVLLLDPLP